MACFDKRLDCCCMLGSGAGEERWKEELGGRERGVGRRKKGRGGQRDKLSALTEDGIVHSSRLSNSMMAAMRNREQMNSSSPAATVSSSLVCLVLCSFIFERQL